MAKYKTKLSSQNTMANQSSNDKDQASTDFPDCNVNLSRRSLLMTAAAMVANTVLLGCGSSSPAPANSQPNILFIMVDQMRFPKVFPAGVTSVAEFLQKFMPNTYSLWQSGVKFANHNSAATMCSPSRGVLVTGLYSHQTWFATTIIPNPASNTSNSPPLIPAYPTYGKLLQSAGYVTPYIGKWHLSIPNQADGQGALSLFGFQAGTTTTPDPVGFNLQGTYGDKITAGGPYYSDGDIANEASNWLSQKKPGDQPWCLTVCLQNPHDQEFFPAGTEFKTFTDLFNNVGGLNPSGYGQHANYSTRQCAAAVTWASNVLASPPKNGYPAIPPNWESLATLQANKPAWQYVIGQFEAMEFGGVNEATGSTSFSVAPYPNTTTYPGYSQAGNFGIGLAPYSYWQRSLDCYTQLMTIVDQKIGQMVQSLPPAVAANTVIVFTSDHGDHASAHGMVCGKAGTLYDEVTRVPLIVSDPTGKFTGDINTVRTQLTSHVDIMPMLVSFAYGGNRSWMQGDYAACYSARYDMFPLLKSANAPGRNYALFSSDEVLPPSFDFATAPDPITVLKSPFHILGLITPQSKLGIYSNFPPATVAASPVNQQYEYYDYSTPNGALELANTYATDANAAGLKTLLLNQLVPNELEAPLPASLRPAHTASQALFAAFLVKFAHSGA